jgi:hypothetical protein
MKICDPAHEVHNLHVGKYFDIPGFITASKFLCVLCAAFRNTVFQEHTVVKI